MSYIGNAPLSAAFLTDTFSGTGSQVAYTMTVAPANTSSIIVAVTGVLQDPSTYSVSGTTLTFSAAPPTGTSNISVRYLGIPASGVTTTAYRTVTNFTATAGQTSFSVPSYTVGYIDVYRNGVRLVNNGTDFVATTGTTVVLNNACTVGDSVVTESFLVSSVLNAIQQYNGSSTNQALTTPTLTSPIITGSTPQVTVYTSGSGTYTTPANARYLIVVIAGGGSGGSGSSTGSPLANGVAGGNSTFGTSLLTANGGGAGNNIQLGGTATVSSPAVAIISVQGGQSGGVGYSGTSPYWYGGMGGNNPLGGAGGNSGYGYNGGNASSNTGGGGGGAGSGNVSTTYTGQGGAAGGYIQAIITSPSATYSYAVGAGGSGGAAGTSGQSGGNGGSGLVSITAYF